MFPFRYLMSSIVRLMTLNRVGHAVTFMKYLPSVVSLIFLTKSLIWNKITFWLLNLLNFAVNESWWLNLQRVSLKKVTNIFFSIQFFIAYCKDFKSLLLNNQTTFQKSSSVEPFINQEPPVLEPLGWKELKWKSLKWSSSRNSL